MFIDHQRRDALKAVIAPYDTQRLREQYRRRDIPRAEAVTDIDRRYRSDLFIWSGAAALVRDLEQLGVEYPIIDSALATIIAPL